MAASHQATAEATAQSMTGLYNNLTHDAGEFAQVVTNLNAAVEGDNGVLNSIEEQLKDIEGQIGGTVLGIVVSGLAIVGGVFFYI